MQVASISTQSVQASIMEIRQSTRITIRETDMVSEAAKIALSYIAASTRLSPSDKTTLTRLVAAIDEFAGGNPKLMSDVIGIARIMELNATMEYKPTRLRDVLEEYFEERARLRANREATINIETSIASLRIAAVTTYAHGVVSH